MELTNTLESSRFTAFNAVVTMFYDPVGAFRMIEFRKSSWVPLLLLIVATGILAVWYFSIVDFSWFQDQMLATVKDAESREKARGIITKKMMLSSALGTAVLTFPVLCASFASYFSIAGKFIGKEMNFGSAFALSVWASVPSLLLLPLGAIQILLSSNGQLSYGELNPLSVNQIFFHYEMTHPMGALLDSLNLLTFLSIFLSVIGFQVWTKVSRAIAIKVVLLPYVACYGIWLAYALNQPV